MARRSELAQQRLELVALVSRRGAQLRRERGRHQLVDEGQAVDQRPVHHAEADQGADAGVLVGLQRALDGGRGRCRRSAGSRRPASCSRCAATRSRRSSSAGRPGAASAAPARAGRTSCIQSSSGRFSAAAALEVLVRVLVAVDEAGHEQALGELDDLVDARRRRSSAPARSRRSCRLDEDVERACSNASRVAEQGDGAREQVRRGVMSRPGCRRRDDDTDGRGA
jgi:hypothetical protein